MRSVDIKHLPLILRCPALYGFAQERQSMPDVVSEIMQAVLFDLFTHQQFDWYKVRNKIGKLLPKKTLLYTDEIPEQTSDKVFTFFHSWYKQMSELVESSDLITGAAAVKLETKLSSEILLEATFPGVFVNGASIEFIYVTSKPALFLHERSAKQPDIQENLLAYMLLSQGMHEVETYLTTFGIGEKGGMYHRRSSIESFRTPRMESQVNHLRHLLANQHMHHQKHPYIDCDFCPTRLECIEDEVKDGTLKKG